jgi:hypothetical protein
MTIVPRDLYSAVDGFICFINCLDLIEELSILTADINGLIERVADDYLTRI